MQLALAVQLPDVFAGCAGECLFVDCEGSLSLPRLRQMAEALHAHVRRIAPVAAVSAEDRAACAARADGDAALEKRLLREAIAQARARREEVRRGTSPAELLGGVHVLRATTLAEQTAAVAALPQLLAARPRVKLVVIDSIAFHYRYGPEAASADPLPRHLHLTTLAQALNRAAGRLGVAVVVTNQMTTSFGPDAGRRASLPQTLLQRQQRRASGAPLASAAAAAAAAAASSSSSSSTSSFAPSGGGGGGGGGGGFKPALGEAWAHAASRRIVLRFDTRPGSAYVGRRCAYLAKEAETFRIAASLGGAYFAITKDGVRSVKETVFEGSAAAAAAAAGGR